MVSVTDRWMLSPDMMELLEKRLFLQHDPIVQVERRAVVSAWIVHTLSGTKLTITDELVHDLVVQEASTWMGVPYYVLGPDGPCLIEPVHEVPMGWLDDFDEETGTWSL